jgi:hypothetical protein
MVSMLSMCEKVEETHPATFSGLPTHNKKRPQEKKGKLDGNNSEGNQKKEREVLWREKKTIPGLAPAPGLSVNVARLCRPPDAAGGSAFFFQTVLKVL